jgi:hypothetical protein
MQALMLAVHGVHHVHYSGVKVGCMRLQGQQDDVNLTCLSFASAACCRLVDEMGQPMGPYRVWLQYAWIPGLAMSRALGDQLAHT